METFETLVALLGVALGLLFLSLRIGVPFASVLALGGAAIAAMPFVPGIALDPQLVLAVFIAPSLLESAYSTSPHELRRNWIPLTSLIVVAVLLTTAAVAGLGMALAGMSLGAAVALGAIVAPPDAVAAVSVMRHYRVSRRTFNVLQGESLLNDATALLILAVATQLVLHPQRSAAADLPFYLLSIPGGLALGYAAARLHRHFAPAVSGSPASILLELALTYGTWLLAERMHVSPILALAAFGMSVANHIPTRTTPRDRLHARSVWGSLIFVLNATAFLLMGLQAREILARLPASSAWSALLFALAVLAVVIGVRLGWSFLHAALIWIVSKLRPAGQTALPNWKVHAVIGWSGMRGLVTLACALSLPAEFPHRDLIVLSAYVVVMGTLVIQGLTMGLIIRLLGLPADNSIELEIESTRNALDDVAVQALKTDGSAAAAVLLAEHQDPPMEAGNVGAAATRALRVSLLRMQRAALQRMYRDGVIGRDSHQRLLAELDWSELGAARPDEPHMPGR